MAFSSEPPLINSAQQAFPKAAEVRSSAPPAALPVSSAARCHSSLLLTTIVYLAALGGADFLNVQTPILDGVSLSIIAAGFLCFWGGAIFPRVERLVLLVEAACIIVALGLSLACLSYLGTITDLPLRDSAMIWIDRHLGFDWLQMMSRFDHQRFLLTILNGAYATFTSQLIGTTLVLITAGRTRDLDRFFATFICASVIAEAANVLAPTLGPMATLAQHTSFQHLPTLGRATGQIVQDLRSGSLKVIDLGAIDGIISFPSLHAAVAVIVPYTLRWNKPLFWPILFLDCVMFVSAIPSGNHYLSDVLGGFAVAVLAILCGGQIQRLGDRMMTKNRSTRPIPG